ncbi:MAG: T9SS type A sorting domain-containing protein, partial [Candidatus Cloacimonadales bacterium]
SDEFFIIYNENYGEGEWTTVLADGAFPVDPPLNQDGTPPFPDDNGNAQEVFFGRINDGHFNADFNSDSSILRMAGTMGLQAPENTYYPFIIFPYTFSFDFATEEFSFRAMETEINENANNPEYVWQENEVYLPWDTDNDGEADEYYDDGSLAFFSGWPIYFHDNDTAFHENSFYIVNGDGGRVVAVWQDGLRNKYAQDGIEGYEEYIEVADIMIAVSNDHGATWSDAILLNNIDTPELAGMKPAYVYPGDVIENLGGGHGRLHLMFYDDNSFGSSVHGFGNADGGTMMYTALDIDFEDVINNSDNNAVAPVLGTLAQNYPNPFNPTTTISYDLQTAGDVTLEVYNTKGQLINTLVDESQTAGTHSVVWDGTSTRGDELSSGVYFYKIKSGKFTSTKKMILLK